MQVVVVADVAADHLADQAGLEPGRQPLAEVAGVVADQREVAQAARDHPGDQRLGVAAQAEPADQDVRAVAQVGQRLGHARAHLVPVTTRWQLHRPEDTPAGDRAERGAWRMTDPRGIEVR